MLNPQAIQAVRQYLAQFAATDDFEDSIESIFGTKLGSIAIRQQWLSGDFSLIPEIRIVANGELGTANGAYAADLDKILVSSDFLTRHQDDVVAVAGLLLEEIGHKIDRVLNSSVDSPGDEGAIFRSLVTRESLSLEVLARLRTEDDSATILLDGNLVSIEKADAEPYLVADINKNSYGSNPRNFYSVGGFLYLIADNDTSGTELWQVNQSTGVATVVEINPGTAPSYPSNLIGTGNTLYFQAYNPTNGYELWKIVNGGTPTVVDLYVGAGSSSPTNFVNIGGTIYFIASGYNGTTSTGQEIWKIDPATGTPTVIEIVTGGGSAAPNSLVNVNGTLYFTAYYSDNGVTYTGYELWRLNAAGTPVFLKDIYAGTTGSNPGNLTYGNGKLYFTADNFTEGVELWETDGTTAGTKLTSDINKNTYGSSPTNFISIGSTLYFIANNDVSGSELWKADAAGNVSIVELAAGDGGINPGNGSANISNLTNVNGTLYFQAYNPTNGYELWKIGTSGTLSQISLNAGSGSSSPTNLINVGGTLYFTALGYDGVNFNTSYTGTELWRIDPTTGNPTVISIVSGPGSSSPNSLTNIGGILYFQAYTDATGYELWKVDPADNLPVLVSDLYAGTNGSSPTSIVSAGGAIYFVANNATSGRELFRITGTAAPELLDIRTGTNGSNPTNLIDVGGILYFLADNGVNGQELWKANPTGAPVQLEISSGSQPSYVNYLTNVGGKLYFRAYDVSNGYELWKIGTDGNPSRIDLGTGGSQPDNLTNINGTLYFRAYLSYTGSTFAGYYQLWKIDSTGTPTFIQVGAVGNYAYVDNITLVGSTLFFSAQDGTNGRELWKLDATGNAVLVKDIRTGGNSSSPSNFYNFGGTLYFTADDGVKGVELWKSDGTAAGTVLAEDINGRTLPSNPTNLINVGNTLYFLADNGINGQELWKVDPTTGLPVQLEIYSGANGSSVNYLTNVNGTLYFAANDATNGYELWKIGTDSNPTRIDLGNGGSSPDKLLNINGTLYFRATYSYDSSNNFLGYYQLWKIDSTGTPAIVQVGAVGNYAYVDNITLVGSTLFFSAQDGTNGNELWKLDASGNAVLVKDISTGSGSSYPANFYNFGGTLYFTADDGVKGVELWKSDGTTAGTVLAKDINGRTLPSNPTNLINVGTTLYFLADNGINGQELWKVDPTTGLPVQLEIYSGANGASVNYLTNVNGTLYFAANDATNGYELWKIGTTGNPTRIDLGSGGSYPSNLTNVNGTLYFRATYSYDSSNNFLGYYQLWKIDSTGIPAVIQVGTVGNSPYVDNLTLVGSTLFFRAYDGTNGYELWKVNASGAAELVKDISTGSSSYPANFYNVNGTLYFTADDSVSGNELWKSDGTATGTTKLEINAGATGTSIANMVSVGGTLYFTAQNATNGQELWRINAAGNPEVLDINAGTGGSNPSNLTNVNGTLYLQAYDPTNGYELWKVAGATGTPTLINLYNGSGSSSPTNLLNINGTLYFTASGYNGTTYTGQEIWKIDPATGTPSVIEIVTGGGSGNPTNLTNVNGNLYFTNYYSDNGATYTGNELWKLDAVTGNPVFLKDIYPGGNSSSPGELTYSNGKLYFSADNLTEGRELWAYDISSINTVGNVPKTGTEDQTISFAANDFASVFISSNGATLTSIKIIALPSNGTLKLSNVNVATNQEILAANLGSLTFVPNANFNGNAAFTWNGSDGTTYATSPATVSMSIAAVNDAPELVNPIPDLSVYSNNVANFSVFGTAFRDVDLDNLTYSATLADNSALPSWLAFNGIVFNGTPPITTIGQSIQIKVTAKDPSNATATDTFALNILSSAPNYIYVSNSGSGTIAENSANDTQVGVLTSLDPSTNDTFTYTLLNDAGGRFKVDGDRLLVANTSLLDYETTTQHTIRVKTTDGTGLTYERDITVFVSNVNDANAGTLSFTAPTYSVNENSTTVAAVTVQRTNGSEGFVRANIVLSNGTATYPDDYNAVSVPVDFANGETSKTVTIPIVDDILTEASETVNLTLTSPQGGATLGTQSTAILTIVDNDALPSGTLAFANNSYSVNENGIPSVTILRTGGSSGAVTVNILPSNGTAIAPGDYSTTPISVSFANGEASKTVALTGLINDDTVYEQTENLTLTLSAPTGGAVLGTQQTANLNIIDNDAVPGVVQFSTATYSVNEDGIPVTAITLTRTGGTDGAVGVLVNLGNGTATAPSDYTNSSIAVNFANGESSKTVSVPLVNDTITETNETINLSLTNPQGGATLGTQTTAVLTILDNDRQNPGTLAFSQSSFTVNEDGTSVSIVTVNRIGGSDGAVSAIVNLTNGSAIAPADYNNTPITVNFANGETSKTVTIPIDNDTLLEDNETVNLSLTSPTGGATLGTRTTAVLNIIDNDAVPGVIQFSNANYSIAENGTPITTVTLNRTGGSDGAVGVRVNLSNGTAIAGSDYISNSIAVSFANGETTKTVNIPIVDDTIVDPNQTINLSISNPYGGATIGTQNAATVTIVDNDIAKLTLILNKENISEGETATGTITRNTEDNSNALVVTLASSDTTETTVPTTVTIPVGQSSVNFNLIGVIDNIVDPNQTATISASATGFNAGTDSIVIKNNDLPDLVVSNIIVPIAAQSGQTIDVTWTLTNQGNVAASGTWTDRLLLSDNDTIGNDLQLKDFIFIGTIAPGESIERTQAVTLPLELSGDRRIVIETDVLKQISEKLGTDNNISIDDRAIAVNISPHPNLQVASVIAPTTAFSSQETLVKWVVTNTGNGNTNTALWYDRIWLSLDRNFDTSDIYLGQAANPSYLNVGESYLNQLTVTLPNGVDSNYYFLVKADGTNKVWEFDKEGDNLTASNSSDVDLSSPPDLQVTSVIVPSPIFSGQKTNVNWTVTNKGEGRTFGRYWYDDIYLSSDLVIDPKTDYYLGRQQYSSFALFDAGASYTESKQVEIPVGLSGNYHFLVKADAGNYVFEQAFEENNTGANATPTQVKLPPPPDLEIDFVDVPAAATASRPLTINYRVTNYGSTRTPERSWTDSFYLSADTNLDINADYKLGDFTHSGDLNTDESYTSSAVFTLPNTLTGNFYVFGVADSKDRVFELDNSNNSNFDNQAITITSRPADLIVSSATTSGTGVNGQPLRIDWTVTNQGIGDTAVSSWQDGIIASRDNIFGNSDDIVIGNFTHNRLINVGGSYSRSELVTIPFSFDGDYNLFVQTDHIGNVYEATQENNNISIPIPLRITRKTPDLQVTQITAPITATSGQPFTVTWKVENLGGNTTNFSSWNDEVFLSTDSILDRGDISLGTIFQSRTLAPSSFYQSSRTFTLPNDIQGSYYTLVRTDINNNITEDALESNNVGATANPTAIALSTVPDLIINNITAPIQAVSGQSLDLTWTVNNAGADTSGNWRDSFYLSRDRILDVNNDIYIGFVADTGGLNNQQNYTKTHRFTLPRGLSGDYYIFGNTDAGSTVYERLGEGNNVTFNNTPIQIVAPVPTDLVAGTITIPTNSTPGQSATITYTVQNQGVESAIGTWQDSIYISKDDKWDINDPLFAQVDISGPLTNGNSYSKTITTTLPGVAVGDYHVIIRSDIRNAISESNEINNLKASVNQFEVDVASLTLGTSVTGYFTSKGLTKDIEEIRNIVDEYGVSVLTSSGKTLPQESIYYKVNVAAGETLRLKLDGSTGVPTFDRTFYNVLKDYSVAIEGSAIYVRYGDVPTQAEFDYSFSEGLSEDGEIVIPSTQAGTYYILATAPQLRIVVPETNNSTRNEISSVLRSSGGGSGGGGGGGSAIADPRPVVLGIGLPSYSLKAEIIDFSIQEISTKQGSNRGRVTMAIDGAKFTPDGVISLIANDGTTRTASKVWWKNSTEMWATFDLQGLGTGLYDVRIEDGGKTALANDIFTVTNGAIGKLETQLITPAALLPGRSGTIIVNYANTGETDLVAPLLTLGTDNANLVLADRTGIGSNSVQFVGIDDEGPAGIIEPGESGSFSVKFDPTIRTGVVNFYLSQAAKDQPINWDDLKASSQPLNTPDAAWDLIWNNFVAEVGTTAGDYQALLAENATQLSQLGKRTSDISELLSFELQQASYNQLGQILTSEIDASAPTSGLDLSFGRSYHQSLDSRLTVGTLGRGWTNSWDVTAITDTNEDVIIQNEGIYLTFTKLADGSYQSPEGIYATVTKVDGKYHLRQQDGAIVEFQNDGKLNYFEDTNGNRITANYTDGKLTSLNPANGAGFTFAYNAQGRLSELTDATGRKTTYTYDLSGKYLLSVTGIDGTTNYSYETTAGNSQHALKSITFPDSTHSYFDYDSQGKLIKESIDGNAQAITYTYDDNGGITVTDANGIETKILLNERGSISRSQDALDRIVQYQYDDRGNLTKLTAPDNTLSNYTYDSRDNLLSSTNALGQKTKFTYESNFDFLQSVKDAKGNSLSYQYDAKGDLTGITYADGSSETFSIDPVGNVSAAVNRRNQTIDYTYNSQGLLTRKDFADGTSALYTYDNRGNLLSATDSDSSVSYTYDSADRLTKVTYGADRSLSFTYDAGGRRTSMTDGNGMATNYIYDSLGQLQQLTDQTGANIVSYSYDTLGRLVKENNGNGTYTTYDYDKVDQLLSLVNYKANNTVNSSYDYTYDVMGRRSSMTTLEGKTNYSYDASGQLTGVNLPNGRIIKYLYDAAGNRISVTDNGVGTNYSTNNLNEYTSAGAATYTYDTDGNLTRKQEGSNTWNYSYDSENRLFGVTSAEGTWTYEYDAIGNRIATIHNGQRTEYVIDPTGLGDVIGEYDGTGSLIANYTHGLGLVSRFDGSNESYYDADAIGSIIGLTGNSGSYLNQYSYLPFGEDLSKTETVSNSFEYVGQWGVMDEGNGLTFMRARYYDSRTGKFTSPDPIGINGGDTNLYLYVKNNPVKNIDPLGLAPGNLKNLSAPIRRLIHDWKQQQGIKKRDLTNEEFKEAKEYAIETIRQGKKGGRESGLADIGALILPWQISVPFEVGYAIGTVIHDNYGDYYQAYFDILFDAITRIVNPSDPNDIVGPEGFGEEKWIAPQTLPYTIRFENQATATAPAQRVTITHPLDTDLDVRTFRLGDFGWSGITFDVPENIAFYSKRIDLTATKGFFVDVAAGVDIATKEAFWILTTIDPKTGEIPTDPTIGFLPPDNIEGIGDGFVNYTIRPSRNATTGTVIDAKATIVFDNEPPIDTPAIFNTLDIGKPNSSVAALPNLVNTPEFLLKWSGNDDENGSGIASYDVYVAENGGNFTIWLDDTTLTEATYRGEYGKTYAFYSAAIDNAGNLQTVPTTAQATTQVSNSTVNQTPILAVNNGLTLNEAATGTINLSLLQVTDADNTPTQLTYTLTNLPTQGILKFDNNPLALNAQFTQAAINNNLLTYTHNGSETISDLFNFTVTDGTNVLNNNLFGININPINDVPVVLNAISAQTATAGQTFVCNFPANTFLDPDLNEVLTYTAKLANGNPLPSWLSFNPANRTFNGAPTADSAGIFNLVLTATDTAQASVSNTFKLTIEDRPVIPGETLSGTPQADNLVGKDGNDTIDGGAGNDTIYGGEGDDIIIGNVGVDLLFGGNGKDIFVFNKSTEGIDKINDFVAGVDRLNISSAGFGGTGVVGNVGVLDPSRFLLGTSATTASHRFIYNDRSGALFFDADGVGGIAQVRLAQLVGNPALTNASFTIV